MTHAKHIGHASYISTREGCQTEASLPNPSPTCGGGGEGENDFIPPLVNIGVGHDLTIRELAETVKQVTGYTGEIVFDHTKSDGARRMLIDVLRLYGLGWKVRTDFLSGVTIANKDYLHPQEESR